VAKLKNSKPIRGNKSVILLWMAGGPSHIDTWDVKPDMPTEVRGPFGSIPTKLPGVRICEYLPKCAAMLDQCTLIRSVDCRESNHQPNTVMQTANLEAEPRLNPKGDKYPAIASIVAKLRGANHPAMPPYVALNVKTRPTSPGEHRGKPTIRLWGQCQQNIPTRARADYGSVADAQNTFATDGSAAKRFGSERLDGSDGPVQSTGV
jgi:hypothetical protein